VNEERRQAKRNFQKLDDLSCSICDTILLPGLESDMHVRYGSLVAKETRRLAEAAPIDVIFKPRACLEPHGTA
jgi:hypothetical protein